MADPARLTDQQIDELAADVCEGFRDFGKWIASLEILTDELWAERATSERLRELLSLSLSWLEWCSDDPPGEMPEYPEDKIRQALDA